MLNFEKYRHETSDLWVVFIHGMGGSTLTWKKQLDQFQQEYNLLLIDLPGHGKSQDVQGHFTHKEVNDEIKRVLDYVGIQNADFVGMSLGTLVIMNFAVAYPTYVNSIILGGAIINVQGIYSHLMNIAEVIKEFLPKKATYRVFAEIIMPSKWHKKSRDIFFREAKKLSRPNFLAWMDYITNVSKQKEIMSKLKALKIPTLFVSGDHDSCFIEGIKKLSSKLSSAKLVILEKCGHVCTIERWRDFNQQALSYLQQLHPVAQPVPVLA
ncbi:MAG: alpha/beta hydrolase [Bacteroidaceae bacterium]|nr:alpha/beta hydrolase [Bacteroidaceae bacterium]